MDEKRRRKKRRKKERKRNTRRIEYPTRRMVNAYTEFLRVEQELSLYGYLRDERGRGGGRGAGERDRKEESGDGWLVGWLSAREKLCFQHQFTPTFSRRARTRWIKLGILRKETRPHIRRIVIRPLHSLVAAASLPHSPLLAFSRPPGFLVSSFAKRPLCRSYFALPWGLPGLPEERGRRLEKGRGKRERIVRVLSRKYLFPRNVFRRCHSAE